RHWSGLRRELRPALVLLALLLVLSAGWVGAPMTAALLLGALPALLVPLGLGRRLGGHSGDSYGACVEWGETLALLLTGLAVAGLMAAGAGPAGPGPAAG
ncbi:MAG: adenosylcobinamide-GDP ribazoletransferase, partial [Cyanobium sp.]